MPIICHASSETNRGGYCIHPEKPLPCGTPELASEVCIIAYFYFKKLEKQAEGGTNSVMKSANPRQAELYFDDSLQTTIENGTIT